MYDWSCCWRAAEEGKDICPVCGQVLGLYRLWTDWAKKYNIPPTERKACEKLHNKVKG